MASKGSIGNEGVNVDMRWVQGSTFADTFTYKAYDDGTETYVPVDLSGYTARMQVRQEVGESTVLLELTTENGGITLGDAAGTIDLLINAADWDTMTEWEALDWCNAVYDLELVQGTVVTQLMYGSVTVRQEVTR
jgi:hypothetical protein